MSFRNLAWCGGHLSRLPYWIALVSLVVSFLASAITFPTFFLAVVPCAYFATCWLANRLRDAGWPAFLAILPFLLIVATLFVLFVTQILTFGRGSAWAKQFQTFCSYVPWIILFKFVVAGLLPSARRSPTSDDVMHAEILA